jgi:hypothetical protein
MPDDDAEVDAQLSLQLAAQGGPDLDDAVKYLRQQRADLRRIAVEIMRVRQEAEAARSNAREC